MTKEYSWAAPHFTKGIDPNLANAELERIKAKYGLLNPHNILKESEEPTALLHPLFEWRDDVAAQKHRLQQARSIVNGLKVTIISSGDKSITIPVFEITKNDAGKRSYVNVTIADANDISYIKRNALKELEAWKTKYDSFFKLESNLKVIEEIIAQA